ncbi:hypothetical protein RJT34_33354 [Clitoria ternatea]|uniref:Formin-like protein n=1 Tax=Clitoria ternatea TaxID=43366 RepID=A0AAN9EYM1_CLITE
MSPPRQGIALAVAATTVVLLLFAMVFLYFFQKFAFTRYHKVAASFLREAGMNHEDIKKVSGNMKGLLVEENGIDILYMMETEGSQFKTRFPNRRYNPSYEDDEEKRIDVMVQRSKRLKPQEVTIPLLYETPGASLIDHENLVRPLSQASSFSSVSESLTPTQHLPQSPQPPPPPPSPSQTSPIILEKKTLPSPPPPPPPPPTSPPSPPPPTSPPRMEVPKGTVSPSKASGSISSLKPPLPSKRKANTKNITQAMVGESSRGKGADQTRLKPLFWDKVVANVDHSTVWDQISDGSFRFDFELMETLFRYSNSNQTHESNRWCLSSSAKSNSSLPTQLFILDPRKSQNTAIILRSLAISPKGIMDAVLDGEGLSAETLERLTNIAPTQEEEAKIIQFSGDPDKLADAESFLCYILRAVPTAFIRLKALFFRSSYDCEVIQLKEHLRTLEMSCNEMKNSGMLLKFLEAVLRVGNRMNVGTSRGNAQGFNLSALKKLSDVKSTDGKTSLLHFIVEQVAQFEGKKLLAMKQKQNLHSIIDEMSNTSGPYFDSLIQQETEREYLMLGLPVLGLLREELSQVKKAARIEHQNFISMLPTLNAYTTEIRQIITCCDNNERGGFIKVMKGLVEECEEELKVVREEQTRIMQLVKKTNEYYLTGGSKDNMSNPFQLYVLVKEFVDMVDEVCIELRRKLEKNNVGGEGVSTPPLSPTRRVPFKFPNLDSHFLSSVSGATSSCSQSNHDF